MMRRSMTLELKGPRQPFFKLRQSIQALLLAVAGCLLFGAEPLIAQGTKDVRTTNPHGSIRIACENCHAAMSWKPIRAKPEFDHNSATRFPLRGMHENGTYARC